MLSLVAQQTHELLRRLEDQVFLFSICLVSMLEGNRKVRIRGYAMSCGFGRHMAVRNANTKWGAGKYQCKMSLRAFWESQFSLR